MTCPRTVTVVPEGRPLPGLVGEDAARLLDEGAALALPVGEDRVHLVALHERVRRAAPSRPRRRRTMSFRRQAVLLTKNSLSPSRVSRRVTLTSEKSIGK